MNYNLTWLVAELATTWVPKVELHAAMTCPSQGHDHEGWPSGGPVVGALLDTCSRDEARCLQVRSTFAGLRIPSVTNTIGFTWCQLISLCFTRCDWISFDVTRYQLVSHDFNWFQLIWFGFIWFYLISQILTWLMCFYNPRHLLQI